MLEELHLPAALDALDKPIGLPPSLKKAEEVRLEDGPRRIDAMLADIQTLSKHVSAMLEEVSCLFVSEVWLPQQLY
jgi:programmed cell death 6-interacting protein